MLSHCLSLRKNVMDFMENLTPQQGIGYHGHIQICWKKMRRKQ
ncbi:unnamed protein product [Gulo gulo]|uniref:Uncharacterized protein n=1 Tax=Gulo gulo TaxID=48420 RepID=A0A9X9MC42_GULGU|nr:unnamed protein product [Gulo gulo]